MADRGAAPGVVGRAAAVQAGVVLVAVAAVLAEEALAEDAEGEVAAAAAAAAVGSATFATSSPTSLMAPCSGRAETARSTPPPFPIKTQKEPQPSYAQNQFGLTFFGAPYIPHLIEHDTKDVIFFNATGQRSSSPFSEYGSVPTAAERQGDLSALTTQEGAPITLYDPSTGLPFPNNVIPAGRIVTQATALLAYIPQPNLPGQFQNYQRLASSESNNTRIGLRFLHSFGPSTGGSPLGGLIRQYLGQGGNSLRQSVNVNFNYSHSAADELSLFPDLSGKQQSHQYSLALGYSIGKGKVTNNLGLNWNRSNTQLKNNFTGNTDIASQLGITGLPENPLLYGLPNVTLNQFTSLTEQQPNFQTNQTLAASDSTSWIQQQTQHPLWRRLPPRAQRSFRQYG